MATTLEREPATFDTSLPFMRVAVVEDATTRDRLVEQLRGVAGAVVHVDPSNRLTSADFAEADYVGVFAALSDVDVVTNANEVLDAVGLGNLTHPPKNLEGGSLRNLAAGNFSFQFVPRLDVGTNDLRDFRWCGHVEKRCASS